MTHANTNSVKSWSILGMKEYDYARNCTKSCSEHVKNMLNGSSETPQSINSTYCYPVNDCLRWPLWNWLCKRGCRWREVLIHIRTLTKVPRELWLHKRGGRCMWGWPHIGGPLHIYIKYAYIHYVQTGNHIQTYFTEESNEIWIKSFHLIKLNRYKNKYL